MDNSYAFNEIVAETTACFALGEQYTQINSPDYVNNYFTGAYLTDTSQELRPNETTEMMTQAILKFLPQITDLARKHGLLK